MDGLTIRAYARHRGVSHTAVRKAAATGRITVAADRTIDPAVADQEWAASTDLSKPRNSITGVPRKRRAPGAPSDPMGSAGLDGVDSPAAKGGTTRLVSSYAASRAAREAYLARLAKLEFEQRSGKLVDADAVRARVLSPIERVDEFASEIAQE